MEDVFMALGADSVTTDTDTDTDDNNGIGSKQRSSSSNSKAVKLMHTAITAVTSSASYVLNSMRTMVNSRRHRVNGTAASVVTVDDDDTVEMINLSTVSTASNKATAANKLHEQLEQHDHSIDINSPIHSANHDQYTTTAAAVGLLHEDSHHSVVDNSSNAAALPIISNGKHAEYTSNGDTKSNISSINKPPNSVSMIRHLLYKRYTVFKRDKKGLFFQMILPGIYHVFIYITAIAKFMMESRACIERNSY
jgi:hypothetical protein